MNHNEMALFKKELQRLNEDYLKCNDEQLKEQIMEDIRMIEDVINMSKSGDRAKV